jgi:hypothetical protein
LEVTLQTEFAMPGEDYWVVTRWVVTSAGVEFFVKADDSPRGWVIGQFL